MTTMWLILRSWSPPRLAPAPEAPAATRTAAITPTTAARPAAFLRKLIDPPPLWKSESGSVDGWQNGLMRRPVRLALALPALAVGALALAAAAQGHGPFGPARGYVSSVSSIEPSVLGLQASVVGDRLVVRNWSTKTVTILGSDGRPYLRFGRRGIFANQGFGWKRISSGTSYSWHDPRVRWTGRQPPAVVRRQPHEAHYLRAWSVR